MKTLEECLAEVQRADAENAKLAQRLVKAKQRLHLMDQLEQEVERLRRENGSLHETSLRLQARVLELEKHVNLPGSQQLEEERSARLAVEREYTKLLDYYNELLVYVRESEHDEGN